MRSMLRPLVLAALLLAAACGAHRLSQAQDSFNEAARLEAQAAQLTSPITDSSQALQNYRIALSLTEQALGKYGDSLKKDKLYGTALVLNALCQWRIAALDENANVDKIKAVVARAEQLAKDQQITLGTRDRVLLQALPGFREHALAQRERDRARAKDLYESSLETLDNALTKVNPPPDHPIRIYIRLFQMRTVRAWRWAEFPSRPKVPVTAKIEWLEKFKKRYLKYRAHLKPLIAANDELYREVHSMDEEIGVDTDPRGE